MILRKGTPFVFSVVLEDGKTDQFVLVTLMDISGVVISTYNVPHVSDGLYLRNDILATTEGIFLAKFQVFKDALFTNLNKAYAINLETIRIENIETNLAEVIDFGDGQAN